MNNYTYDCCKNTERYDNTARTYPLKTWWIASFIHIGYPEKENEKEKNKQ